MGQYSKKQLRGGRHGVIRLVERSVHIQARQLDRTDQPKAVLSMCENMMLACLLCAWLTLSLSPPFHSLTRGL